MANTILQSFIIFSVAIIGVTIESIASGLHDRISKLRYKEHKFTLSRYLFFILFPTVATLIVWNLMGMQIWIIFLAFALIGTFFEWLIGFSYEKIVGKQLWTYHRYSINGYTSLLSIPLWGFAGIIFYLLAQLVILYSAS